MTQTARILQRLKSGPLTPLQALRELGCMRLAARVLELRQAGHAIQARSVTVRTRGGRTRVCEYRLQQKIESNQR